MSASGEELVLGDDGGSIIVLFEVRDLLAALHGERMLESIDVQLAELCVRRGEIGEEALAVALATALTSRARREGHSALALDQLRGRRACGGARHRGGGGAGGPVPDTLPSGDEGWWRDVLGRSRIVGDGASTLPLVLRDGLLQFRRYFDAEQRIARHVQRLVQVSARTGDAFSIITGGPGRGRRRRWPSCWST